MENNGEREPYYNRLLGFGGPFLGIINEYFSNSKSELEVHLYEFNDVLSQGFISNYDRDRVIRFFTDTATALGVGLIKVRPIKKKHVPFAWLKEPFKSTSAGIELSFLRDPSVITKNVLIESDPIYFVRAEYEGTQDLGALDHVVSGLDRSLSRIDPDISFNSREDIRNKLITYNIHIPIPRSSGQYGEEGLYNLVNATDAVKQAVESIERIVLGTKRLEESKARWIEEKGHELTRIGD